MAKKLSGTTKILILGILIFLIGCIQPYRYELAKESGYEVEATVVEVQKGATSEIGGETIEIYAVYADYTVNGQAYSHVKLKNYGSKSHVGEKVKIVVDPNNPGKALGEGGVVCVVGFLIIGYGIFAKISEKKKQKASQNEPPQQTQVQNI